MWIGRDSSSEYIILTIINLDPLGLSSWSDACPLRCIRRQVLFRVGTKILLRYVICEGFNFITTHPWHRQLSLISSSPSVKVPACYFVFLKTSPQLMLAFCSVVLENLAPIAT